MSRQLANAQRVARRRLIVQRALAGYADLPAAERIELLLGAAEVLPRAESEAAKLAAFALQESERQQTTFLKQLGG